MAYSKDLHTVAQGSSHWEEKILPLRQQATIVNRWLRERLENLLPQLMQREGFDMWVVACREYNEDPVFLSLVPEPTMAARRLSILVFCLQPDGTLLRYVIARSGIGGDLYQVKWEEGVDQWLILRQLVEEYNPSKIGIGFSHTFAFGDGLSSALYQQMQEGLGEYSSRLQGAERLAVAWLETRTDNELAAYEGIVAMAHGVIAEAFSNRVVHPGVTTNTDVVWWIRQRFADLGLRSWFQPSISVQRQGGLPSSPGQPRSETIIMPGDILHCDVGFVYLRLCTDTQQNAYVLKRGECEPPKGLQDALKAGNQLQDIVAQDMEAGGTGNEILARSRAKAIAAGLVPSVYNHPIGYHGHGAGPTIGLYDQQDGVPGRGDYELHDGTCHALELNVRFPVPEWDNQEVTMALEQTIAVKDGRFWFLDGRQVKLHLI
ncbi:MAG: M24 family metallopeptidase [Symbiobacteriaceae bacterium]|nr:M24 family metallopeptidase [Symbiobacteriaceae bacterium]